MHGENKRGNESDKSLWILSFFIFPDLPLSESAVRSRHKKQLMVSQNGAVSVISLLAVLPGFSHNLSQTFLHLPISSPKVIYCIFCPVSERFVKWVGQGRPAPVTCTAAVSHLWQVGGRRAVLALEKFLWKAWTEEETNQTELLRLRKNVAGLTL